MRASSFEGGFPGGQMSPPGQVACSPPAPQAPATLHTKLTDLTLTVRLHDLDNLTVSLLIITVLNTCFLHCVNF